MGRKALLPEDHRCLADFAQRLSHWMHVQDVIAAELARRSNVGRGTITGYTGSVTNGSPPRIGPSYTMLMQLIKGLGLTPEQFFGPYHPRRTKP